MKKQPVTLKTLRRLARAADSGDWVLTLFASCPVDKLVKTARLPTAVRGYRWGCVGDLSLKTGRCEVKFSQYRSKQKKSRKHLRRNPGRRPGLSIRDDPEPWQADREYTRVMSGAAFYRDAERQLITELRGRVTRQVMAEQQPEIARRVKAIRDGALK